MDAVDNVIAEELPRIEGVSRDTVRPLWSVMIPNYNSGEYLRKTIKSVLAQDPGEDRMQIEVVDHCSTDDPHSLIQSIGQGRIGFYRRPRNEGPIANFNACIQRSRGHLIHILHSDDYVLPGFYAEMERLAHTHPDVALLASRCFIVDDNEIITDVTRRLTELESASYCATALYYDTVILFPGVVIRREFYEREGGYMPKLVHTADREMWVRAISTGGGVISSALLACYRVTNGSDSGRMVRSGENVRDLLRLTDVFSNRYGDYSARRARSYAAHMALRQAKRFETLGDEDSRLENWRLWIENSSWVDRVKETLIPLARRALGRRTWHEV